MNHWNAFCLGLAMSMMSATAHATILPWDATGNDYKAMCSQPADEFSTGDCMGYLAGVTETLELSDLKPAPAFCIPVGVTRPQVTDVFEQYLDAHPERRQRFIINLLEESLIHAWPSHGKECK